MENFEKRQNVTISAQAVKKIIDSADGECALVLLQAAYEGRFSVSSAAASLGLTRQQVSSAADRLRIMGIPMAEHREDHSLPQYRPEEIASTAISDTAFVDVKDEASRLLGKILSASDLNILHGIYDHIGLSGDVMILLIHHCIDVWRLDNGEGRMPTMRYIEKEAWFWEENGITTIAAADAHIAREMKRRESLEQVRSLMQIRDRGFVNMEKNYVSSWLDKGFPPESIAIAYDRTVTRTGKMSWKYADTIISSWFSRGLITPEDIQAKDPADRGGRTGSAPLPQQNASGNPTEMTQRLLNRLKGENS